MNEEAEKIIDRAEEVFKDAIYGDIELTKDISSYITWVTALATGGIALSISQSTNLLNGDHCQSKLLIASNVSLFLAIIIGAFAKYQAQLSIRNYRIVFAIGRMQRFHFYRNELTEDPIKFGRRYHNCEFLDEKHQNKFKAHQKKNKRWCSEENGLWVQLPLFLLGYVLLAILAIS
ncbi:hypothetical protein [Pseudoalteromonas sp. UBA2102]|uniref:hypothetical protein n=1 Tax=Pseudoalteromonas sp. UBA2102 TaxID=1947291 RepID=UPI00257D111C|nr:hypothetical protein [Pseudoalteromonas sp. UBA2102]|tara:strand:+ start:11218 stop:11745 length:528 start_codon:yes stop_codon:yes gene_type:complete